eukprot:CAMPEP_0116135838 /NCGR_PEP_ID=MMETSP0329-20121206/11406_1 /TAXON_ID=697910 /ORGANISM="Pseudo-nitzschia arenysensis, Strain B593" /LENGTH=677 /DNA_ID=CAMNT_0003630669 /DNA_START=75 /DNA_END=2108 /DNA_ORIENTATION=+
MPIRSNQSQPESNGTAKLVGLIFAFAVFIQLLQITNLHPVTDVRLPDSVGELLIAPDPSQKNVPPKVEEQSVASSVLVTPDLLHASTEEIKISNPNASTEEKKISNPNATTEETTISNPDATTTWSKVRDECFPLNSDKWLSGTIASNNADNLTPELVDTLIEGPMNFLNLPSLFDQTMCHEDSPIRTFSSPDRLGSFSQAALTDDWYQRLLYLALHWKFHKPALEEHKLRKTCAKKDEANLNAFMNHHNIQSMDFECSDAKFIVIPMGRIGFGAYLNSAITIALYTNRIPIFSSKSFFPFQKNRGKQDPWILSPKHCESKDLQCYFLPFSPCTVTIEELEAAPIYGNTRPERKKMRGIMNVLPEHESSRVVVINTGLEYKARMTPELNKIASDVVKELLDEWKNAQINDGAFNSKKDWEAIDLAHKWVTEKFNDNPEGLFNLMLVYLLRPNPHYNQLLDQQISQLVPKNNNPSETVGLAIRGSDKCAGESTCYPFDRYMELATEVVYPLLQNSLTNTRPKLIMTTEDPNIFNSSLAYQRNSSFQFEFLVNNNDNMQGSGHWKSMKDEGEETIVSSLIAIKFHFYASRVYVNCCSNWHMVITRFLLSQCGGQRHRYDFVFGKNITVDESIAKSWPTVVSRCLNGDVTPRKFRICCQWSKSDTCADIYNEDKARKSAA